MIFDPTFHAHIDACSLFMETLNIHVNFCMKMYQNALRDLSILARLHDVTKQVACKTLRMRTFCPSINI